MSHVTGIGGLFFPPKIQALCELGTAPISASILSPLLGRPGCKRLGLERFSESLSWKASVQARSAVHLECEDRVMPEPLPKDVRDRFARPIIEGPTGRDAARRLRLSAATGGR